MAAGRAVYRRRPPEAYIQVRGGSALAGTLQFVQVAIRAPLPVVPCLAVPIWLYTSVFKSVFDTFTFIYKCFRCFLVVSNPLSVLAQVRDTAQASRFFVVNTIGPTGFELKDDAGKKVPAGRLRRPQGNPSHNLVHVRAF